MAGPQLQESRRAQQSDIDNGATFARHDLIPDKEIEITNRFLINLCTPLHKLIGSTPDSEVCDRLEASLRLWLGDSAFEQLITELNQEVLQRAKEMPQRTEDELADSIAEHRQRLLQRLQP